MVFCIKFLYTKRRLCDSHSTLTVVTMFVLFPFSSDNRLNSLQFIVEDIVQETCNESSQRVMSQNAQWHCSKWTVLI